MDQPLDQIEITDAYVAVTDQPLSQPRDPQDKQRKQKAIWSAIGGAVILAACLAVFFSVYYLPKPVLDKYPASTKESKITLEGKTRPKASVVAYDGAGNALLAVNADAEGKFVLRDLPIGEGDNTYRLRAMDSWRKASSALTVKISKDTTSPELGVNALDNAQVTGSNTVVSGKAEPGTTVTVNGVKTDVKPDGTWSATVTLQPGQNTVTVAATDQAGNVTTQTQTVAYTPSAQGSQTGTATVTTSTTSVSPGSLAPASPAAPSAAATSSAPAAQSPTTPTTATANPAQPASPTTQTPPPTTPTAPAVAPPPAVITGITASAWISNAAPNERANETISVSVKDSLGRPVTGASVTAAVMYKSGTQHYTLAHQGNGLYTVSFKLNDKYTSGFRVAVGVSARYQQFTSTASTGFTPN